MTKHLKIGRFKCSTYNTFEKSMTKHLKIGRFKCSNNDT